MIAFFDNHEFNFAKVFHMFFRTALAVALVGGASVANAATFADRATFEAAITIDYIEDFQSLTDGSGLTGPVALPSGLVVSTNSNDMFVPGPGQSTNVTTAIGSNTPIEDTLYFDLGMSANALGMDIFQNNGGGGQSGADQTYELSVFAGLVLVETVTGAIGSNGGGFLGVTTVNFFDNASLISISSDQFEVVDNVTVGTAATVPLPAGLPLIGAAILALGALGKRRKAA